MFDVVKLETEITVYHTRETHIDRHRDRQKEKKFPVVSITYPRVELNHIGVEFN